MDDIEMIIVGVVAFAVLSPRGFKSALNGIDEAGQTVGNTLSTSAKIIDDSGIFLNWFPDVVGSGFNIDYANQKLWSDWRFF